jgi:hypothetical protein
LTFEVYRMAKTTTVPISVTPEAAARVAELGFERELQQMLDHTIKSIPGLRAIEVQLALPYDTGDETSITIEATRDLPPQIPDPAEQQWGKWVIETYHPDVWSRMRLFTVYGTTP